MIGINLDLSGLDGLRDLEEVLKVEAADANRRLAASAHAHAVELATKELRSRSQPFLDALSFFEADGVAVIQLAASAAWIEEGLPARNLLDILLSSPKAKVGKRGQRYVVVPFDHSPGHGETNTPPAALDLVNTVRGEMKRQKIPWAKIERDDQGRPKLGRLHKFSISSAPLKTGEGPGMGRGPIDSVRQGPNMRQRVGGGPSGGGRPFLAGVGVYQTAAPGGGVKRSVMTFRIASSDQQGEMIWDHPGLEGARILDRTEKWIQDQIDTRIAPELIERVLARL